MFPPTTNNWCSTVVMVGWGIELKKTEPGGWWPWRGWEQEAASTRHKCSDGAPTPAMWNGIGHLDPSWAGSNSLDRIVRGLYIWIVNFGNSIGQRCPLSNGIGLNKLGHTSMKAFKVQLSQTIILNVPQTLWIIITIFTCEASHHVIAFRREPEPQGIQGSMGAGTSGTRWKIETKILKKFLFKSISSTHSWHWSPKG